MDSSSPNLQLKVGPVETVYTHQQSLHSQPFQAREADVEALSQLTRALDKKVVHHISFYALDLIYWEIFLSPSLFFNFKFL